MFNAISGFSVCIIMLILGVYIVSFSSVVRKQIKAQQAQMALAAQEEDLYNREGYDEEYRTLDLAEEDDEEDEDEEIERIEGSVGEVVEISEKVIMD